MDRAWGQSNRLLLRQSVFEKGRLTVVGDGQALPVHYLGAALVREKPDGAVAHDEVGAALMAAAEVVFPRVFADEPGSRVERMTGVAEMVFTRVIVGPGPAADVGEVA